MTNRLKKNYENATSRCQKPAPDARTDARTTPAESTYRDHKVAPLPIFDRSLRDASENYIPFIFIFF